MPLILRHTSIRIQAGQAWLDALLAHAPDIRGLVLHASPFIDRLADSRDNHADALLREAGFGTLLVNLLTPYEDSRDPDVRFDVSLLAQRLGTVLGWVDQQPQLAGLPIGLIAVDTVAGAAIRLLARDPERMAVLCLRSPRPDLAGADPLRRLRTPTLLQLPAAEPTLRGPCEQAFALMSQVREWTEIPDASAGLIEPGSLDLATRGCRDWLLQHMPAPAQPAAPPDSAPAA